MLRRGKMFSFLRRSTQAEAGLLILMAVISLVAITALGTFLTWTLANRLNRDAIRHEADNVQANLTTRVARQLSEEDLVVPMTGQRYAEFQRFLEESVLSDQTLRVKLWGRDGTVVYSDDPGEVGTTYTIGHDLAEALGGEVAADFETEDSPDLASQGRLLEVYAPLTLPGSDQVVGAFEIYQNTTNLESYIATMRKYVFSGLGIGLGAYYLVLLFLVHRGVRIIRQQQEREASEARAQDTVGAVVAALDLRDTETEHHATRVAEISVAVGRQLGLTPEELAEIETGALLHDVGKIGIADQVLRKAGPLTEQEWAIMRRHSELGYEMMKNFPSLQAAALLVHAHHEHFNGGGYPRGLAGEAIPVPARIFAVADAYDAITSNRPYRSARSHEEALAEIRRSAGSQFDPEMVRAFLAIADRFARPASRVGRMGQADQHPDDIVPLRAA